MQVFHNQSYPFATTPFFDVRAHDDMVGDQMITESLSLNAALTPFLSCLRCKHPGSLTHFAEWVLGEVVILVFCGLRFTHQVSNFS